MSKTHDTICFALIVTAVNMCVLLSHFLFLVLNCFGVFVIKSEEGITSQAEIKGISDGINKTS